MTELLNVVRLMFSRLGTHRCPNGHPVEPSPATMREGLIACPVCGARFEHPSAESFSFNSFAACPECGGLGERDQIDPDTLVPDPTKTIAEGAVAPWGLPGRSHMPLVAAEMGVRTDVSWERLTDAEREVVLDCAEERRPITIRHQERPHVSDGRALRERAPRGREGGGGQEREHPQRGAELLYQPHRPGRPGHAAAPGGADHAARGPRHRRSQCAGASRPCRPSRRRFRAPYPTRCTTCPSGSSRS